MKAAKPIPSTSSGRIAAAATRGSIGAPASAYAGMRQYVGAVAVNDAGTRVAATSPVGGHVLIFDAETRGFVESRAIADVCGIAPDGRDFFISDGRGRLWQGPNLISEDAGRRLGQSRPQDRLSALFDDDLRRRTAALAAVALDASQIVVAMSR